MRSTTEVNMNDMIENLLADAATYDDDAARVAAALAALLTSNRAAARARIAAYKAARAAE
jgi:hypothetical protein